MKNSINPVVAVVAIVIVVGVALVFGWKAMSGSQEEAPAINMGKMGGQMQKPGK